MATTVDQLAPEFGRFFGSIDLTPLYEEIGEVLMSSIARNFRTGGRVGELDENGQWTGGASTWLPSKRAKEQNGRTLQDKNILARSISYSADITGLTIGSNLVYAAIHQYGGAAGRGGSVILPPRPYIMVQSEDLEEIEEVVREFYERIFETRLFI